MKTKSEAPDSPETKSVCWRRVDSGGLWGVLGAGGSAGGIPWSDYFHQGGSWWPPIERASRLV